MRDKKYDFIYDDTPEKRKFVDNWCKLSLETGNVVTIGKDSNDAYLIGYSEDSIIHHPSFDKFKSVEEYVVTQTMELISH